MASINLVGHLKDGPCACECDGISDHSNGL